jgi:hypothetical protein
MSGKLSGKKPGTLGKIQVAFKEARKECKFLKTVYKRYLIFFLFFVFS